MSNGSRWGLVFVILAILALLFSLIGPISGIKSQRLMQAQIKQSLTSAGYDGVNVDMAGNVARLSGDVSSEAKKAGALDVARNVKCDRCSGKKARSWHAVKDAGLNVKVATVSPYTFKAIKNGGIVRLDGYVQSKAQKADVLAHAKSLYGDKYEDKTIRIAAGAPSKDWGTAVKNQMTNVSKMRAGRATLEDYKAALTGRVGSQDTKAAILASSVMPAGYSLTESISAPQAAPVETPAPAPVIKTEDACQAELARVKGTEQVRFAYNRADVAPESFALLNNLAAAAKRCPDFFIQVQGHTDSDGSDAYNLDLSQRRAATVAAYLADQGVKRNHITAKGFGEAQPIAPNTTREGKRLNRRIAFVVTSSN